MVHSRSSSRCNFSRVGEVDTNDIYHGYIVSKVDLRYGIGGIMVKFAKPFKSSGGLLRTRALGSNLGALRGLCRDGAHNNDIDVASETQKQTVPTIVNRRAVEHVFCHRKDLI